MNMIISKTALWTIFSLSYSSKLDKFTNQNMVRSATRMFDWWSSWSNVQEGQPFRQGRTCTNVSRSWPEYQVPRKQDCGHIKCQISGTLKWYTCAELYTKLAIFRVAFSVRHQGTKCDIVKGVVLPLLFHQLTRFLFEVTYAAWSVDSSNKNQSKKCAETVEIIRGLSHPWMETSQIQIHLTSIQHP